MKRPTIACGARIAAVLLVCAQRTAFAGADHPWSELEDGSSSEAIGALVLGAVIAFVVHLVEKGEFLGLIGDLAKGLSFLATMYLAAFSFIVCIILAALALQAIGIEKSIAGFIAVPLGLFGAFRLYSAYQTWRNRKRPE